MAILEVHHGRGRVERVIITRDHPALFGSNSRCDIVIDGEVEVMYGTGREEGTRSLLEALAKEVDG